MTTNLWKNDKRQKRFDEELNKLLDNVTEELGGEPPQTENDKSPTDEIENLKEELAKARLDYGLLSDDYKDLQEDNRRLREQITKLKSLASVETVTRIQKERDRLLIERNQLRNDAETVGHMYAQACADLAETLDRKSEK